MCLAQVYVKIQIINLLVGQKNCSFKLCQFSNCLKIQTNIFFKTGSVSQIYSVLCGGVNMIIDFYFLLTLISVISLVSSECYDSNIQYSTPSDDIKTFSWRQVYSKFGFVQKIYEDFFFLIPSFKCYEKMLNNYHF